MSPKYEEDLSSALGAICEVLTRENHLLFVGRIQEYDRAGGRLCAELRKGEGTPGGVLYHEPVKVHIYMGQEQGKVMIAYGQVERNAADHWWIELENVVSGPERRENFRQMVRGRGILTDREGRKQPCNLVDISISGVKFYSQGRYIEGAVLELSGFRLRQEGELYTLLCLVRRVERIDAGKGWYSYGCSFYDLRPGQEDQLCRDIFNLQARSINRKS